MVEAQEDNSSDWKGQFRVQFFTRMLQVLELPPCDDMGQAKELVMWAFERDHRLNKDLIIRQVVDEIHKSEVSSPGSPLLKKCALAQGTWIKKIAATEQEYPLSVSDKLAHSNNSLGMIKRLVLGEFVVRSHKMPAGTKSDMHANRDFNDLNNEEEDDKSEEPDVIEIQNQAANYL